MPVNEADETAGPGREIKRGAGAVFPDWSAVTSETARAAVVAALALENMEERWSGLDDTEDRVRRAVLAHYVENGRAPSPERLAAATGVGADDLRGLLESLAARDMIVLDPGGDVITGAYPFSDRDTGHRVHMGDLTLNAMCAVDALGAGAMCGRDITVHSSCAACGAAIRIATRDRGAALQLVLPESAVVWLGVHYAGGCAANSLCPGIAFFCADEHLEAWRATNHPGLVGYRLSIDEGLEAGRAIFAPMLA